jgi:hypothetical protein
MRRNTDNQSDINTPTSSIKPDGDQNYRKSFVLAAISFDTNNNKKINFIDALDLVQQPPPDNYSSANLRVDSTQQGYNVGAFQLWFCDGVLMQSQKKKSSI